MASIHSRVQKIEDEIEGVASQYGVTSWDREFLDSIKSRTLLTEKQEKVLGEIEQKVFEGDD